MKLSLIVLASLLAGCAGCAGQIAPDAADPPGTRVPRMGQDAGEASGPGWYCDASSWPSSCECLLLDGPRGAYVAASCPPAEGCWDSGGGLCECWGEATAGSNGACPPAR